VLESLMTSQRQTFTYRAYSLNISSDIECPELLPADDTPDVHVRYGSVPEQLERAAAHGVLYEVSRQQFLLKLEGIARFLVADGHEVVIERAPEATDDDIRVFLLGSIFAALLYQRGFLPLHASAIETRHGAVAFAGLVGLGKSTLAAAFHQRGYRILADDVCAISLNGHGAPLVTPAYPQLNLWADAIAKVGATTENLRRTRAHTEKYRLSISRQFAVSSVPLYAVYELGTTNMTELRLAKVKGLDKLAFIKDNTFRLRYLQGMNQREHYMQIASATARHARAARIVRPEGAFLLDELADLVEHDLRV